MPNRVRALTVRDQDRTELERRARSKSAPARIVQRARIVLSSAQGLTGPQIAERVGCTEPTVVLWRRRSAGHGIAGSARRLADWMGRYRGIKLSHDRIAALWRRSTTHCRAMLIRSCADRQ